MKVKYFDLKNKRVFISGGGSGIGATIVEHFCEQNSEVYFIDIDVKAEITSERCRDGEISWTVKAFNKVNIIITPPTLKEIVDIELI